MIVEEEQQSFREIIQLNVEGDCEKSMEMKELSIDEEVDNRTENDEKLRSALHGENEETNGKDLLKLGIVHTVVDYVLSLCSLGPSGVRALPLAAGINVGGHYKWHFFSFSLSLRAHCSISQKGLS